MADPFEMNILGVRDLVESSTNKHGGNDNSDSPEGVAGEKYDALELEMTDEELLALRDEFEKRYAPYESKLKPRVEKIKASYLGAQATGQWLNGEDVIVSNLQFEAEETYLAAALSKNPEPYVYADNTPEGNAVSGAVKTMLQYHSEQLHLRSKIKLMVRQHSMYLLGSLKPGWNEQINDVAIDNTKIKDYVFDPEGFVDANGDFSSWYGERKKVTAEKLIELFPKHKEYITLSCDSKLGTEVIYTEWWPNDEYCFYTYKEKVLQKNKNHLFKYPEPMVDVMGQPMLDESGEPMMTKPRNHFAHPKKPGIFLSVYSLQEQPHDITSLVEQNIPNQNRITRQTDQIDFNISASNNGYAFSEDNFNQETGKQAANARRKGNPILIPSGGPIANAILALPAAQLPNDFFVSVENHKNDLRSSWGIQGIAAQQPDEDQTARGMILNQQQDTTRIGGGIGQSIEQVADNAFNWLVQLYYVFYDEQHFAAIMGQAKAVEYVTLSNADLDRQLIVGVSPDSMKPKDDITNINLAQALFDKGAIGPITLLTQLDFASPKESAADGVFWQVDKVAYFQTNFPEEFAAMQQSQMQQAQTMAIQGAEAKGLETAAVAANTPPEQTTEPEKSVVQDPASAALSQIPL